LDNPSTKIKELTVWTNNKCNLKCKYCFVYKLNEEQPYKVMTEETADHLIDFAVKNLEPNGKIWFFGAEPLCNFDIIKYIVAKSCEKGYKWQFGATTNATLIDQEKVQWMKQINFGLLLSIDGPKESHNTNRIYADGTGSWDDAWKGLELVRKAYNPNPQLRWTVTPSTVKDLAEKIKTIVEEHNLTNLAVDFTYEVDWNQDDLAVLKKELEIFGGYYKTWMAGGKPVFSMFIRDANSAVTQTNRQWCARCGLGNGSVGVDYDGTLYPCHRFIDSHKIKIGDVYNGFNATHKQWIEEWQKVAPYCEIPKKCLTCNFKKACSGGCIAMNYDLFGTPHINAEAFCTIKQLIVSVLGELCKSLQANPTFQKQYGKNTPTGQQQNRNTQPHKPCGCSGKVKRTSIGGETMSKENGPTPTENSAITLSAEIQQQLATVNAQAKAASTANSTLELEMKKMVSALITENLSFKQENAQLKAATTSKS
jgi:uncharacterized protein